MWIAQTLHNTASNKIQLTLPCYYETTPLIRSDKKQESFDVTLVIAFSYIIRIFNIQIYKNRIYKMLESKDLSLRLAIYLDNGFY